MCIYKYIYIYIYILLGTYVPRVAVEVDKGEGHLSVPEGLGTIRAYAITSKPFSFLDVCVSSLRRGHANILCIVPILTDDPRRESGPALSLLTHVCCNVVRLLFAYIASFVGYGLLISARVTLFVSLSLLAHARWAAPFDGRHTHGSFPIGLISNWARL